ncbi:hypothetical protein PR048_015626 [Dryococelus australis]|uniref:Uncharacterized protein n=1 Tax=Dryococelus australis TaxID=614101 RepID=A0ABQ9HHG2_9NEOP|nr:hypothetical protein PR048_015626 [Dryococelus australis]
MATLSETPVKLHEDNNKNEDADNSNGRSTVLEKIMDNALPGVDAVPRNRCMNVSEKNMEKANECHVEQEDRIVRSELVTPPKRNPRTDILS